MTQDLRVHRDIPLLPIPTTMLAIAKGALRPTLVRSFVVPFYSAASLHTLPVLPYAYNVGIYFVCIVSQYS